MDVPIQVTFRGVDQDNALEQLIHSKAEKLERVCDRITSLRVAIEKDKKKPLSGDPYRVRLDINVPPGKEFVIKRETAGNHDYAELPTLIRDGFEAALRKLKKITEKQKGKVKSHPNQEMNGIISKVFPEEDYGFIRSTNERDVYFHRNSVVSRDFDDLKPGDGVAFVAQMGEKGLQASTVHVVNKPSE